MAAHNRLSWCRSTNRIAPWFAGLWPVPRQISLSVQPGTCRACVNTEGKPIWLPKISSDREPVGEHGPQPLRSTGALVHVFPAVVEDPPVVHH